MVMIVVCLCMTAVAITAIGGASMFFALFFGGAAMACFGYAQRLIAQPPIAQPQVGFEYQYIKPASFVSEIPVEILNGILEEFC